MIERCKPGDWVEVEREVLGAEERASGLPPETAETPLIMWVKGFARGEAAVGERIVVETPTGRIVDGHLTEIDPGYAHTFGRPLPEISRIGRDLQARLAAYRATEEASDA